MDQAIPCSKQMPATVSLCNCPLVLYGVTPPTSPVTDVFTTHQVLRTAVAALNTPSYLGLHIALPSLWYTLPCAWQANSSSLSRLQLLWKNIL